MDYECDDCGEVVDVMESEIFEWAEDGEIREALLCLECLDDRMSS